MEEEYVIDLESVKIFDAREEWGAGKFKRGNHDNDRIYGHFGDSAAELLTSWVKIV